MSMLDVSCGSYNKGLKERERRLVIVKDMRIRAPISDVGVAYRSSTMAARRHQRSGDGNPNNSRV